MRSKQQIKENNKILEEKYAERFDKKIKNYELQREQPLHPSATILFRSSLRFCALKQLTVDLSSFAVLLQSFGHSYQVECFPYMTVLNRGR